MFIAAIYFIGPTDPFKQFSEEKYGIGSVALAYIV
jgi:hypothetical protein